MKKPMIKIAAAVSPNAPVMATEGQGSLENELLNKRRMPVDDIVFAVGGNSAQFRATAFS